MRRDDAARDREKLAEILEAAQDIAAFLEDLDLARFQSEKAKQYAILYPLMIIGEAASQLSEGLRDRHGQIPWRRIINFRHRVVHGYGSLDLILVWEIAQKMVPELVAAIQRALAAESVSDTTGAGE